MDEHEDAASVRTKDGRVSLITSAGTVAVAASLAGAVVALFSFYSATQERTVATVALREAESAKIVDELSKQNDLLRAEIEERIQALIEEDGLPPDSEIMLRFQSMDARIRELSEKIAVIDTIETAITENPERAMSIPIIRRDVDALGEDLTDGLLATRNEVDRLYDMSKWFLGLIATMAIGVLGLAFGAYRRSKE